jgi:hypothetical protein
MILLSAFFLPFSTAGLEISAYLALLGFLIGGQYLEKLHFIKKEALVLSALGLMAIVLIWSLYSSGTPHDIVTRIKAYEKLFMILVALWTFTQHPQMRSVFLGILIGAILMNFVLGMLKFHHLLPSQWSSAFQSDSSASFVASHDRPGAKGRPWCPCTQTPLRLQKLLLRPSHRF